MPFDSTEALTDRAEASKDAACREFDEVATLASVLCRTPRSMVMLRSEGQGWIRASGSMRLQDAAIPSALCELTVRHGEVLTLDADGLRAQLSQNFEPMSDLGLHFFAGVPFSRTNGEIAGILCVADRVPRVLSSEQEESMALLARQLTTCMELQEQRKHLADVKRERQSSASNLRASEELFRTFMDASPFLSYIKDAAGRLLFYNRSFARRFGISEYAWLGRRDEQLWSRGLSVPAPRVQDLDEVSDGQTLEAEEELCGADGVITVWKTYKFPCYDSAGNLLMAGLAMDVTEEKSRKLDLERFQIEMQTANEQLRRLSVTDELTGLRNRRAFEERLALEFSVSRRRHRELAVLLIDVDNFKRINDRWGHAAGDAVLRRLSVILRTTIRLPDLAVRYGGEEFAVLLPESGAEAALGFSSRLMERMASETWEREPVTVSIGVAALNDSLHNGFQLVSMADEALYAAKRAGKNRTVPYGATRPEIGK